MSNKPRALSQARREAAQRRRNAMRRIRAKQTGR